MSLISVITVVRNDFDSLRLTERSIMEQRELGASFEWIVIDGCSNDGTVEYFSSPQNESADIFISEPDNGIYDAMNKGIKVSTGQGLIFLNAGDYFDGKVLGMLRTDHIPCFLEVRFTDYFGKIKRRKIVNEKLGISNCHQGIVFERSKGILYDLEYKVCADYKFFLDHGYTSSLKQINVNGFVYWNQGMSLVNWRVRDKEIFEIRKLKFGIVFAIVFETTHFLKRLVRTFILKK